MSGISRRQSRELALQLLFQKEFSEKLSVAQSLELFRQAFAPPPEVQNYAFDLLTGVEQNLAAIDSLIQTHSAHWTLKRMALVDLNIMRLAVFEMKFAAEPLPPAVAINEAVDISKKFGSRDSAAFVNGILDQVVK